MNTDQKTNPSVFRDREYRQRFLKASGYWLSILIPGQLIDHFFFHEDRSLASSIVITALSLAILMTGWWVRDCWKRTHGSDGGTSTC